MDTNLVMFNKESALKKMHMVPERAQSAELLILWQSETFNEHKYWKAPR